MIFGISGDVASFSEEAAKLYSKNLTQPVELKYLIDMEGVLKAIENKKIDLGILPVVNLKGGLVKMAFQAMGKHLFEVVDDLWLKIEHCLLIKPEVTTHQIQKIISHPQAIAQCHDYLQTHFPNVELIEWQNTAKAARDLSLGKLPKYSGVIGHKNAAQEYGLKIAAQNIQDENPNLTAFIIIKGL